MRERRGNSRRKRWREGEREEGVEEPVMENGKERRFSEYISLGIP